MLNEKGVKIIVLRTNLLSLLLLLLLLSLPSPS